MRKLLREKIDPLGQACHLLCRFTIWGHLFILFKYGRKWCAISPEQELENETLIKDIEQYQKLSQKSVKYLRYLKQV